MGREKGLRKLGVGEAFGYYILNKTKSSFNSKSSKSNPMSNETKFSKTVHNFKCLNFWLPHCNLKA